MKTTIKNKQTCGTISNDYKKGAIHATSIKRRFFSNLNLFKKINFGFTLELVS
ncbi:hypothetical protein HMPREF1882_00195 [Streptococcus agalactiae]|nr:hypothetical protein HMPREF1882_00195 [Streptococcus agalactiae]